MVAVTCPYCGMENHTSCPELMSPCAYCEGKFAESRTPFQRLVVLDREVDGVWDIAEALAERWQEDGELENEVIVDRRYQAEDHEDGERRLDRLVAAGH